MSDDTRTGSPLSQHPPEAPASPEAAWTAVHTFVGRCRRWAADEITRREAAGRPTEEWRSYLRFTDHTLAELQNGTLDPWFLAATAVDRDNRPS